MLNGQIFISISHIINNWNGSFEIMIIEPMFTMKIMIQSMESNIEWMDWIPPEMKWNDNNQSKSNKFICKMEWSYWKCDFGFLFRKLQHNSSRIKCDFYANTVKKKVSVNLHTENKTLFT